MSSSDINREYYDTTAAGRDDYWRYMAAPRQRVRRILQLVSRIEPRTVAELGCGDGRLIEQLSLAFPGVSITGIDIAARQLDQNRLRRPDVTWIEADLQQPIASRVSCDVVIASEVIEHLDDPRQLLENGRRLASDQGHLVVTTQSGPVRETERRVGHVRHFTTAEMTALLESAGWEPLRVWNEGFPFHDLSKWWANRDPEGAVQQFGDRAYGLRERAICVALRGAFLLNSRRKGAQLYALARRRP